MDLLFMNLTLIHSQDSLYIDFRKTSLLFTKEVDLIINLFYANFRIIKLY